MRFDTFLHGLLRKRVIRGDPWSRSIKITAHDLKKEFASICIGILAINGNRAQIYIHV
jgi:hypothetical protein